MNAENSISKKIFKGLIFTKQDDATISSFFKVIKVQKGVVLIKPEDIVNDIFFISSGCLRAFYIDRNGKEHTIQFGIKDWWISDFTAFFSGAKAIMYIEVLKDAILYKITSEDRETLHLQFPEIHTFIRKKLESAFAAFQKRILSSLSETATERYINFIKTYPNIEKSIKNYHIASYLGITTESLSRIRKDLLL